MKKKLTLLIALSIIIGYFLLPMTVIAGKEKEEIIIPNVEIATEEIIIIEEEPVEIVEEPALKSAAAVADEIILGLWGNGAERRQALESLGYNYDEIQAEVDKKMPKQEEIPVTSASTSGRVLTKSSGIVPASQTPSGYKETWYSQRVLPGGGLKIPGRHVDNRGVICDADGYVCVSVNANDTRYPRGSLIETTLGTGKVYDTGCAPGVIDIYTDWR